MGIVVRSSPILLWMFLAPLLKTVDAFVLVATTI
jgi:hypothetical protein